MNLSESFSTIDPAWRKLLFSAAGNSLLKPALKAVVESADSIDDITPPLTKIFTAFQLCSRDKFKVVILGQDPYPTRGHASGLAFAVDRDGKATPKSMINIFAAIKKDMKYSGKIDNTIFFDWAEDGVLMLNTALTTLVGQSLAHEKIWKAYTDYIIEAISSSSDYVVWILWGAKAHTKEKVIDNKNGNNYILKWGHPSPLSPVNQSDNAQNFAYCNNFSKANEILISKCCKDPISWIPERFLSIPAPQLKIGSLYCGADGACSGNGTSKAKGAWAYTIYNYDNVAIDGLIRNNFKTTAELLDDTNTTATNQRAELLAIINLLKELSLNKEYHSKEAIIISDSRYAIQCITTWGPQWVTSGKTEGKKNLDIILPGIGAFKAAQELLAGITFVHVRGHRIRPSGGSQEELLFWELNDTVDKAATSRILN